MLLDQNKLNLLRQQAQVIINSLDKKEAFLLFSQLEPELTTLGTSNPELSAELAKLVARLKWVASPMVNNDQKFLGLFRQNLLEGLEIDFLSDLVADKLAIQFGYKLEELVRGILLAMRENNQVLGANPIRVKNEENLVKPTIRHWLLDFLRSSPNDSPTELDESNYLFENSNVKNLTENEKKLLKKLLFLYNTIAQTDKTLALQFRQRQDAPIAAPPDEGERQGESLYGATPRGGGERREFYGATSPPPQKPTIPDVVRKSLRELVKENQDALNQPLTAASLRLTDFDQPVRPTIKNWLVDYVKIKGTGHHEPSQRDDYLLNNPNAKSLTENERTLVMAILRAYDDDLPLPVDAKNQTILLDQLTSASPAAPRGERNEFYGAAPTLSTSYREPITQEDLAGPLKQNSPAPARPAPRLSGNVIDLTDIGDK